MSGPTKGGNYIVQGGQSDTEVRSAIRKDAEHQINRHAMMKDLMLHDAGAVDHDYHAHSGPEDKALWRSLTWSAERPLFHSVAGKPDRVKQPPDHRHLFTSLELESGRAHCLFCACGAWRWTPEFAPCRR